MQVKVVKLEILVVDFDGLGQQGVIDAIETARYPNHCISPNVLSSKAVDVDWDDTHPLNHNDTAADEAKRLFA